MTNDKQRERLVELLEQSGLIHQMTNDKQRERLVELLEQSGLIHQCAENYNDVKYYTGKIADYLLANGVIVPPCKVGQTVYQTILLKDKTGFIVERKVVGFHLGDFPDIRGHKRTQYLIVYHDATNSITHIDIDQIGKTVFLTKEEAEQALNNFQNGNSCEGGVADAD